MIHFDLPKQKSSIIKVLGIGGGGSNAVNFMYDQHIEGVDFIVCNTDAKAIEQSKIPNKIQLGPHLTQGLGAGANPEVGKRATEESLQEIKSILEVNTKMAFVTAGMGGGTGTGGAPIVAQICKELGILTVGIVTTPFAFEGPRRMLQAEEGIKQLKPYVDTLLVISNDKLRLQYGNLKMKEAFYKADNVLATAAKCITDIINSRGHIIVDFADVCTVMKNGGVAILGKSEVEGENRAIRAIEEALNSPLLNDNEIKGAKWVLININTSEGEHECTMDELDEINSYLRMQAGENTDVIMGTGYDNTLEGKIGITLIATGFDAKDPFDIATQDKNKVVEPEKIVLTLGDNNAKSTNNSVNPAIQTTNELPVVVDPYAPKMHIEGPQPTSSLNNDIYSQTTNDLVEEPFLQNKYSVNEVEQQQFNVVYKDANGQILPSAATEKSTINISVNGMELFEKPVDTNNGFLSKPSRIYAENEVRKPVQTIQSAIESMSGAKDIWNNEIKLPSTPFNPQLINPTTVESTIQPAATFPESKIDLQQPASNMDAVAQQPLANSNTEGDNSLNAGVGGVGDYDEIEYQRRKAIDRINQLRNLKFNINEPLGEYEHVPAYIRKRLDLFDAPSTADNFFAASTVGKDEKDQVVISGLNSFIDGKIPD